MTARRKNARGISRGCGHQWPSNQRAIERNKQIIREAKDVPCADCGRNYPYYVMDFDHREPKSFGIGGNQTRAEQTLRAEIAKCDVVCANCHRERTHRAASEGVMPVTNAVVTTTP